MKRIMVYVLFVSSLSVLAAEITRFETTLICNPVGNNSYDLVKKISVIDGGKLNEKHSYYTLKEISQVVIFSDIDAQTCINAITDFEAKKMVFEQK